MAKRIYTPRPISPEVARENAISAARSHLMQWTTDLERLEQGLARRLANPSAAQAHADKTAFGLPSLESVHAQIENARAMVAQCEATLASLNA